MKSFYAFRNKDAADTYVNALFSAGFEEVNSLDNADFILYDSEGVGGRRNVKADFLKRGVGFIYPHTPLTCYIWDGIYQPLPVAVNFVAGKGQKRIIREYGYPYRVEACGFPRCEVRPFQPSSGRDLLFVPARPRRDNGRQTAHDLFAFKWICDRRERFDRVTVCRLAGQLDYPDKYMGIDFITTNPKETPSPAQEMIDRIDRADLIISTTTPAALAIARGKPTIVYGQGDTLETLTGQSAKHYASYKDCYDYPLCLENMDFDCAESVMREPHPQAEEWKRLHIGGNFDAGKFLSIVREYV